MELDEYRIMREAEEQHFWFRGSRSVIFDWVDTALESIGGRPRTLDVGAGTGGVLAGLSTRGDVWGVELNESGARYVAGRGLPVVRARLPNLPFADASFDLAVSLDVFEHIDNDVAAMADVRRVLRPGGRLIATVPALRWLWSEHDEALHHFRRYHKADFASALQRAGFQIRRLSYYNATLLAPIAAARLAGNALRRIRPNRAAPSSDVSIPPAPINDAFAALFGSERHLLKHLPLPIGASLIADLEA
jgi:SAM-dependent methyltransferase